MTTAAAAQEDDRQASETRCVCADASREDVNPSERFPFSALDADAGDRVPKTNTLIPVSPGDREKWEQESSEGGRRSEGRNV